MLSPTRCESGVSLQRQTQDDSPRLRSRGSEDHGQCEFGLEIYTFLTRGIAIKNLNVYAALSARSFEGFSNARINIRRILTEDRRYMGLGGESCILQNPGTDRRLAPTAYGWRTIHTELPRFLEARFWTA